MVEHTLQGLKILITRPRDQAIRLTQEIEAAGGIPVLFPLLDITPVQDEHRLQLQISQLSMADLVIFISPNAVKYGMDAILADGREWPSHLKALTVGQGSAQALRARGVAEVLLPFEQFDSEGLLSMPVLQSVLDKRIMIFRGEAGRELLGDTLKVRGALVEYVPCYCRQKSQQSLGIEPLDAITVTSSEALAYLWQGWSKSQQALFGAIPLFVPHARIFDLACQQGWSQVYLTGAGDEGVLSELRRWASVQKTEGKADSTIQGVQDA
jgi:uroporphyrinogen-III synthase